MSSCNIQHSNKIDSSFCTACCLGKIRRPFPPTLNECPAPLHLMHTNLWGPSPIPSSSGYKYYIHFVDDYTKFTWIYLLRNKSEAFPIFCQFKAQLELLLESQIKSTQSDKGDAFTDSLKTSGIHHRACPGAQQQNGTAERKHRKIVEIGLALLTQASMPLKY